MSADEAAPVLRLRNICKSHATPQGPLRILGGVDLELRRGESVALTGESGSGKSTLLHIAAGLDMPDSGEVMVGEQALSTLGEAGRARLRRESLGVVFQQFNLVASLTVSQNLAFQARLADRLDRVWLEELTARLGLDGLRDRFPEQLSGGQQQRVAIGRALAVRPKLLLADEPTGNLDEAAGNSALQLALELTAETGCGFLMVTHSARLAARLSRRLVLENSALSAR